MPLFAPCLVRTLLLLDVLAGRLVYSRVRVTLHRGLLDESASRSTASALGHRFSFLSDEPTVPMPNLPVEMDVEDGVRSPTLPSDGPGPADPDKDSPGRGLATLVINATITTRHPGCNPQMTRTLVRTRPTVNADQPG